jgi:hypothetical protein
MSFETIYMPLLNEGTQVWVPVVGERLEGGNFRIMGLVPDDQDWAFQPGELVVVQRRVFSDGSEGLAATRRLIEPIPRTRLEKIKMATSFRPSPFF